MPSRPLKALAPSARSPTTSCKQCSLQRWRRRKRWVCTDCVQTHFASRSPCNGLRGAIGIAVCMMVVAGPACVHGGYFEPCGIFICMPVQQDPFCANFHPIHSEIKTKHQESQQSKSTGCVFACTYRPSNGTSQSHLKGIFAFPW